MAAYKAATGNLIRGQDISVTVIKDGLPVETVGPFKTLSLDFEMDRGDDGYLAAKLGPPSDAGGNVDAAMTFGTVTFTMKSKPDAAFWESLAAKLAPEIKRKRAEVIEHMLRGGLFLHPVGFLARVYVSRTFTGAWLVRARCASLHGAGPVVTSRIRCSTRKLAMRAARGLLVPLLMVPGEDRPIDAVPLFAERDGSRIQTAVGVVEFPGEVKCQACKRRGATACRYKCGVVLCAGCGADHQPPDCPPQMAEIYEQQGQVVHDIRDEAAAAVERAEIRSLLFIGACDQTWCVGLGPEDGDHLQIIDGWTKYADLPAGKEIETAAEILHAVGFRAGMALDDAERLLAAAEVSP